MLERVASIEANVEELKERTASLETDMENMKAWQMKQNGNLARLEEKIDKIYLWIIGLMGGVITSLLLLIVQFFAEGK